MTVPDETEDKNGNLHGLSLIIMYLVLPKAQALSFYSSRSCAGSFYAIDVIILFYVHATRMLLHQHVRQHDAICTEIGNSRGRMIPTHSR